MMKLRAQLWLLACLFCAIDAGAVDVTSMVYVGTSTGHGGRGIYSYQFNSATGRLTALRLVAETPNPSFLAVGPSHRFLYAANEISNFQGKPTGVVSAFAINPGTGTLSLLNQVSSRDEGPAHVSVDRTGKYVFVSNYGGGSAAVLPILENGGLGEASAVVRHKGSGPNPQRQEGPHVHAVELSPDLRFALVADLGLDQLFVYPFDRARGSLGEARLYKIKPGSGPRHLVFSPDGRFVYLINELLSTVTVFSYGAAAGTLSELQTVSTLRKDFTGESTAAEIAIHPSGKFLYASNRGEDSITVFSIDGANGTLTPIEDVPAQGKTPRNFALDPSGSWLLVGNQQSNSIVTFRVDSNTGRLTPAGHAAELASPLCIVFAGPIQPGRK